MTETDLLAIAPAAARPDLAPHLGAGLAAAEAGGLLALLVPALPVLPRLLAGKAVRARLAAGLLARERLLETLLPIAPLLVARPGLRADAAAARDRLAANAALLEAGLRAAEGRIQYQIRILWDPAAALAHYAGAPDFAAFRAAAGAPRAERGAALRAGAEALAQRLAAGFRARLDAVAEDRIDLPADPAAAPGETLLSTILLLHAGAQAELDAALEAIDAEWTEGLRLRVTGPLPPLSFLALADATPGPGALARAARRLGLPEDPAPEARAIEAAFRARAFSGAAEAEGGALAAARLLLLRCAAARAGLAAFRDVAGPDRASPPPPLLSLCRDGAAETERDGAGEAPAAVSAPSGAPASATPGRDGVAA